MDISDITLEIGPGWLPKEPAHGRYIGIEQDESAARATRSWLERHTSACIAADPTNLAGIIGTGSITVVLIRNTLTEAVWIDNDYAGPVTRETPRDLTVERNGRILDEAARVLLIGGRLIIENNVGYGTALR